MKERLTREEIEEPGSINQDLRSHAQRYEREAAASIVARAVASVMSRQLANVRAPRLFAWRK
jgi:hypothetical protein